MNAPIIVFLGKPGSGKGTQAEMFSKKTGFSLFKTSGGLRSFAAENKHVGEKILKIMDHGHLLPAWLIMHLWLDEIFSHPLSQGLIIDGAVRQLKEAELFHGVLEWIERPYKVFSLEVSDGEMKDRIEKRAGKENRTDDTDETLLERMEEYKKHTEKSLEFFNDKGHLVQINGEGSIEKIHEEIMKKFEELFPSTLHE
ncbi:MAG: nucleoside monophosphate kinase [Patescibacteria group bacterium]